MNYSKLFWLAALGVAIGLTIRYSQPQFQSQAHSFLQNKEDLSQELDEIYRSIAATNASISNLIRIQTQMSHYMMGHDFRHPIQFCPECGLLGDLAIRHSELEKQIEDLAALVATKPDDELKEKLEKLSLERSILTKHLYSADQRAKEVAELMKQK